MHYATVPTVSGVLKDVTIEMHFDGCRASTKKAKDSKCFIFFSQKKEPCAKTVRHSSGSFRGMSICLHFGRLERAKL